MSEVEKIISESSGFFDKYGNNVNLCAVSFGQVARIAEEFQERITKLENFMPDILSDFEKRLVKIESVLNQYLKPNSRSDIDRLEQRLGIIELNIDKIKTRIYHE